MLKRCGLQADYQALNITQYYDITYRRVGVK